jgi:hypothetical protein
MSLKKTNYENGVVFRIDNRGTLTQTAPQYTDHIKPWETPNFLNHSWLNMFSHEVQRAIERSRGTVKLNDVGLSETTGEFIYDLTDERGVGVRLTAKYLAGIYNQNPGGWPAVAAELDRLLGIDR